MVGTNSELPKACVFDAYGTLFDGVSAAARAGAELGAKRELLSTTWRQKQLQYTWLRTIQGRHADFRQVTGEALDCALDALGLQNPALRDKLMEAYQTLDAFPEVPEVLERLRRKGIRTAILSNGTPAMLHGLCAATRIAELVDAILSVEEVGVYKPHAKVYQLAVDRLGLEPQAIVFLSSNGWDAWAASAFGMRVVWCNRYGEPPERLPGRPDYEVRSLSDLPWLG
jgi:2-haloacid dehalogenase